MAAALTSYYVAYGDWRKMFTGIDEIAKVTADDVQRVAKQYLIPDARTVVWIIPPATAPATAKEAK
jgi:zinc protease